VILSKDRDARLITIRRGARSRIPTIGPATRSIRWAWARGEITMSQSRAAPARQGRLRNEICWSVFDG
jgi:hypothetical protein